MKLGIEATQLHSRAELLWFGVVLVLCALAIFGSFEPDPVRRFAPKDTAVYVSWKENGVRFARAYLADGSISDLSNGIGITVKKIGTVSDTHIDLFPSATPLQNLRIRFSSAYGIRIIDTKAHLLFGTRTSGTTSLLDTVTASVNGTAVHFLPNSLLLWSTQGEPIAVMNTSDREPTALAEGRYGANAEPSVILRTQVPDTESFLKLITAFDDPKTLSLTLDDGSIAREIVAATDTLITQKRPSVLGDAFVAVSKKTVPLILPIGDATQDGIPTLIMSSSSVLDEKSSWSHPSCPITSLQSLVQSPFFALGSDQSGHFIFCAE